LSLLVADVGFPKLVVIGEDGGEDGPELRQRLGTRAGGLYYEALKVGGYAITQDLLNENPHLLQVHPLDQLVTELLLAVSLQVQFLLLVLVLEALYLAPLLLEILPGVDELFPRDQLLLPLTFLEVLDAPG